jgi:hypothetical protein
MLKTTHNYVDIVIIIIQNDVDIVIITIQNDEKLCRYRDYQHICLFCVAWVKKWLLFNAKWAFFSSNMTRRNYIRQDDEVVCFVFTTFSSIIIDWNM